MSATVLGVGVRLAGVVLEALTVSGARANVPSNADLAVSSWVDHCLAPDGMRRDSRDGLRRGGYTNTRNSLPPVSFRQNNSGANPTPLGHTPQGDRYGQPPRASGLATGEARGHTTNRVCTGGWKRTRVAAGIRLEAKARGTCAVVDGIRSGTGAGPWERRVSTGCPALSSSAGKRAEAQGKFSRSDESTLDGASDSEPE